MRGTALYAMANADLSIRSIRHQARSLRVETAALVRLAWPLIANNLFTMSMQVADTVMAGRLGAADLAAVALGGAIWTPIVLLGIGTLTALSASSAQLTGAGRIEAIGSTARQGLWLAAVLGIALTLVLLCAGSFVALLGLDPATAALTRGYLDAIACGTVGTLFYQVLRFTSEGFGRTLPIMAIGALALCANVLGNWLLMYGKLGLPALGAVGCGWASAITMWLMAFAMAVWFWFDGAYRRIGLFAAFERPRLAAIAEIARVGAPAGVSIFLEVALFASAALLMGWMGTHVVAAHQIAVNYAGLMFMVPLGLAFATTVRVGQAAGRADPAGVRRAGAVGIGLAVGFMTVSGMFMLVLRERIVALYTDDAQVTAIAIELVLVAAAFQIFDGAQAGAAGALRGLKDTRVPMLITLIAYWGTGFPVAWWLGVHLGLGPQAIWVGLVAGLAVAAVLLGLRFARVSRIRVPVYDGEPGARAHSGAAPVAPER
ncbi:MAG: MATE family efflux transporter [Gammaproteobacteria bacterium]|nr:MATE family efflux transporter [Gammaproteobacteria bacterium]